MKKMLLAAVAALCSLSASAQFMTYEPLYGGGSSQSYSSGNQRPFLIYEPMIYDAPRRAQPRVQTKTYAVTGYYQDRNQWKTIPCKLEVAGDEVKSVSYKTQHGFFPATGKFCEVGGFDPDVVRDNFNYKVWTTTYGTIYF
mgnify:CR=1 FL=1